MRAHTSVALIMMASAQTAFAASPNIMHIHCYDKSRAQQTIDIDLGRPESEPNITIADAGTVRLQLHGLIQTLTGDEQSRFPGKTWYYSNPAEGLYLGVFLNNAEPAKGGFGDMNDHMQVSYYVCQGE